MCDNGVRPEQYVIRVKGHLDPSRSEWFEGLTLTPLEGGETTLSGPVVVQAALHGLLAKIRDLNLTLISVTRIEPKQSNGGKDENSN